MASLFNKEDFVLFSKYSGQKVNNCPSDAHDQLKKIYIKLDTVVNAMAKFGFIPSCRKNPQSASRENSFKKYFWAQLYPISYEGVKDKIMFNISFTKNGFSIATDRKRNNPEIEKIDKNSDTHSAEKIHLSSQYTIPIKEVCALTEDELVQIVKNYCYNPLHIKEFLEIGSVYRIEACIKELEKLRMEEYKNLLLSNQNIILTGAPGTGKTYLAKEIAKGLGATEENGQLGFVQFHPSYDYTDFVEGLRPIKKNGDTIGFERRDGIFMAFCRRALADKDNNYVFIIDEINRGEMSKILGELFLAIDPGYRGKEGMVSTQYSNLWEGDPNARFDGGDKFYIPENVYIIGTMNDIDRSVESMDFAMRRRFAFKEVKAEDRQSMIDECDDLQVYANEIKERMNSLNKAIVKETPLDSAYQIGGAYYLKLKNYLKDGKLTQESWTDLWLNHLQGLLFEYFRGDSKRDEYIQTLELAYNLKSLNND